MPMVIQTYSGTSFCGNELDVDKIKTDKKNLREFLWDHLSSEMGIEDEEIEQILNGYNPDDCYGIQDEVTEHCEEAMSEEEQGTITWVWID